MKGGTLEVRNGDPTFHNVRGMQAGAVAFNLPQNKGAAPITKPVEGAAGDTLSLHCDVHPWMQGFVRVSDHPFFATTGVDGTFSIPEVPPGKYTLEVWHPNLGSTTATVRVKKGKKAKVTIEYDLDDCGDC